MEPAQDPLSHTTQGRNYTTSMPSRISTVLFQDPALVWGSGAGRESHIPAEGRKPKREDGCCCCCRGFQLALTNVPELFTGQDNRQATEKLLHNNGKCHVHFRTRLQFIHIFAFLVLAWKLFQSFVAKRWCFSMLMQILDVNMKAFTFSIFCISLYKKKHEILPTIKKNPTLIRDKTKQLNIFNVPPSFKVQGIA